jgi:hypothetical protein
MADTYYSIAINASNVNHSAFYQLDPSSDLSIMQGGFTCYPSATAQTTVAIYPQLAQLSFPAANFINGSVTILTSAMMISGNFLVSPAINSDITLTLYGAGGNNIGTVTLPAGQTSVRFDWNVVSGQGMSQEEARNAISEAMKPQS